MHMMSISSGGRSFVKLTTEDVSSKTGDFCFFCFFCKQLVDSLCAINAYQDAKEKKKTIVNLLPIGKILIGCWKFG